MFNNKRILVVEDDNHLAQQVSRVLRQHGAVVLGPAPTAFYAMHLLGRRGIDVAILDDMLHGTPVFDFADELARRGINIVFTPAASSETLPPRFRSVLSVPKPYEHSQLIAAVASLALAAGPAQSQSPSDTHPRRERAENNAQRRLMLSIGAVLGNGLAAKSPLRSSVTGLCEQSSISQILYGQSCDPQ